MFGHLLDFYQNKVGEERVVFDLPLSESAFKSWKKFWHEIESELNQGGRLGQMKDWGSKLPGAVARVAGLFHFVENHKNFDFTAPVEKVTMEKAIKFGRFLIEHAEAAFNLMALDTNIQNALTVVDWLKREKCEQFTQRDCHKALQFKFKTVEQLKVSLKILEDRNYIRQLPAQSVPHRPSIIFDVNPSIGGAK